MYSLCHSLQYLVTDATAITQQQPHRRPTTTARLGQREQLQVRTWPTNQIEQDICEYKGER